jgi:DNA-binding ferritin-like protein (Dps family)
MKKEIPNFILYLFKTNLNKNREDVELLLDDLNGDLFKLISEYAKLYKEKYNESISFKGVKHGRHRSN